MDEYISREAAVDAGYLSDWYISSVGDESPIWTDEHIDELLNDFLVIPKDTPTADVQPMKRGRWIVTSEPCATTQVMHCSNCGHSTNFKFDYCSDCGARMDGESYDKP